MVLKKHNIIFLTQLLGRYISEFVPLLPDFKN